MGWIQRKFHKLGVNLSSLEFQTFYKEKLLFEIRVVILKFYHEHIFKKVNSFNLIIHYLRHSISTSLKAYNFGLRKDFGLILTSD